MTLNHEPPSTYYRYINLLKKCWANFLASKVNFKKYDSFEIQVENRKGQMSTDY